MEPVSRARRVSVYRLQKFVARPPVICLSVAAIAAALIAGTVVSVRQAIRARRRGRVAAPNATPPTAPAAPKPRAR